MHAQLMLTEVSWWIILLKQVFIYIEPCVIQDCVESVSDGKDGAVFKLSPNGGLDEIICLQVDSSCSFIQDENPRLPQESSSQTHQLPLAHTVDITAHSTRNTALQRTFSLSANYDYSLKRWFTASLFP